MCVDRQQIAAATAVDKAVHMCNLGVSVGRFSDWSLNVAQCFLSVEMHQPSCELCVVTSCQYLRVCCCSSTVSVTTGQAVLSAELTGKVAHARERTLLCGSTGTQNEAAALLT
jgi:hypothetical protein